MNDVPSAGIKAIPDGTLGINSISITLDSLLKMKRPSLRWRKRWRAKTGVKAEALILPYLSFMWPWLAKIIGGISVTLFGLVILALGTLLIGGAWVLIQFIWR